MTDKENPAPNTTPAAPVDLAYDASARESLRRRLQADVEAFLKRGGQIEDVPIHVRAEPVVKPENPYGREPF